MATATATGYENLLLGNFVLRSNDYGKDTFVEALRNANGTGFEVVPSGVWFQVNGEAVFASTRTLAVYVLMTMSKTSLERLAKQGLVCHAAGLADWDYAKQVRKGEVIDRACGMGWDWSSRLGEADLQEALVRGSVNLVGFVNPVVLAGCGQGRVGAEVVRTLKGLGIEWDGVAKRSDVFVMTERIRDALAQCAEAHDLVDFGFNKWQVRLPRGKTKARGA